MSQDNNNKNKNQKEFKFKFNFYWIYGILFALILAYQFFNASDMATGKLSANEFKEILKENDIKKIVIVNEDFAQIYMKDEALKKPEYSEKIKSPFYNKSAPMFIYNFGDLQNFENELNAQKAEYNLDFDRDNATETNIWDTLIMWLPFILLIGIWFFIMRRMSGAGGGGGPGGQTSCA